MQTITGQGIPFDIYRCIIKSRIGNFSVVHNIPVTWWAESARPALSVQLTIVLITHNTGLSPCSQEKVWWKLAAADRQESASGGKEKTQGASMAQAEVSPFRAGTPGPHLIRQGCCSSWLPASLIGHRCQVPHACLCAMRAGMGCWLSMPHACPHSQGRLSEGRHCRHWHSSWPPYCRGPGV